MDSRALMETGRFKIALDQLNKTRCVDSALQDRSTAAQTTRVKTTKSMNVSAVMKQKQESVNTSRLNTTNAVKTKKKATLVKKKTETNLRGGN